MRMPAESAMRDAWAALGAAELPEMPFWARDAEGYVRLNLSNLASASKALYGVAWLGAARSEAPTGLAARLRLPGIVRRVEAEIEATQAAVSALHVRLMDWYHRVRGLRWTQADLLQVMEELEPNARAALRSYFTLRIGLEAAMATLGSTAPGAGSFAGAEGLPSVDAVCAMAALGTHNVAGPDLDAYLRKHGHRGPRDVTPTATRWWERPEALLLAAHIGSTRNAAPSRASSAPVAALLRAADVAWDGLALVMAAAQLWLGAVATEVTAFGLITDPGDVLLLELEELKQVATGEWHGGRRAEVREQVKQRQAQILDPAEPAAPASPRPAGGGQARGPVLRAWPWDDVAPQGASILVTEHPDAGWTNHWLASAGLVSASEDLCSPGLIVARVLGLPLVVGAAEFVQHANTGMPVSVDGDTGQLIFLD
jgi:phosphohistidine swiveling domain-containing protein